MPPTGSSRAAGPAPDRRAAILEAALALFEERGFDATPMPAIAERAQVGAGTIYRYFESKEALGNEVYRECKRALRQHLHARSAEGAQPGSRGSAPTPREEFHTLWRGLRDFARQRPTALRFLEMHHHERYLDHESRVVAAALSADITGFLRRAQAADAVRPGDPALWIALAFGAFVGLVKEAEQGRFVLDEEAFAASEEAVWALLRAERPTQARAARRSSQRT